MIWANPWAWAGLAAVAVPILIHLLARERAAALPFPTLRFLRASAIVEARRRRLTDLPLLAVRCAIVAAAVAALAQPFTAIGRQRRPARLVIVDTTPSVDRAAANQAAAAYAEAAGSRTMERGDLRAAFRDAAAWAIRTPPAEIIVVSDFQRGAFDAESLRHLPEGAGVTLHRVAAMTTGDRPAGVASLSFDGVRTSARWHQPEQALSAITVETAQTPAVAAAIAAAAGATAGAWRGSLRPTTFILPDAPRRAELLNSSAPATERWHFDLFTALPPGSVETVRVGNARALVFLTANDAAAAADAIRRAIPALAAGPAVAELEPLTLTDEELRRLERPAAPAPPASVPEAWAGRWLWIAALILLAIEAVMRRARAATDTELARAA